MCCLQRDRLDSTGAGVGGAPAEGKALQRMPPSPRSAQPAEPPRPEPRPRQEEGFFAMMPVSLNYMLADSL